MVELQTLKNNIIDLIVQYTNNFSGSEEDRDIIKDLYRSLLNISKEIEKQTGVIDDSLFLVRQRVKKTIFLFDFNEKIYNTEKIELKASYTEEEAKNIIKTTINNTRKILKKEYSNHPHPDLYEGACGFSQFASLYPLQEMGFKITINNSYLFKGINHGFGTVTIPINENGNIINKQYLIDCTFMQFFTLSNCLEEYDDSISGPDSGYYIEGEDDKQFVKNVIENGYFEVNDNNIKEYLKFLYYPKFTISKINEAKERFDKFNFSTILNNLQCEFDYDVDEFNDWGYNLDLINKKNTLQ